MKATTQPVIGALAIAAIAALVVSYLAAQPTTSPPAARATTAPESAQRRLLECPEALGANSLGGPCIPRTLRDAPPDPGPDNDKTLAGIDVNRNGVRDDVERYVLANFADRTEKTAYLMQYARAVAPFTAASMQSSAEALQRSSELSRANACAARLIGPPHRAMDAVELRQFDEWLDAARLVEIQHLNTVERTAQFVRNERLLGGQTLTLPEWPSVHAACDFPAIDQSSRSPREKQ